jgi:hypothetical protein
MTQKEYYISPPYPKVSGEAVAWVKCVVKIEDTSMKIDFINNDRLFFEVKYEGSGVVQGSIKNYLQNIKNDKPYVFTFCVEYDAAFKLTINSHDNSDLSHLKQSIKSVNSNPYSNRIFA